MSIDNIQEQIISEFTVFSDWTDKYEFLIEEGKNLPLIEPQFKNENLLIKGCQSQVWLHASFDGEKIHFRADSDAIITKGIIALLIRVLDNATPEEIIQCDIYFVDKIGLKEHLSPTRANGLVAMIKQMKLYALAFQSKNKNLSNNG